MTSTVTNTAGTLTPVLINGYRSARAARNVLHPIIGSAAPSVTLRAAGLRTGTLAMLCETLADALALEAAHAAAGTLQLEDSDLPALNMLYVSSGSIEVELDTSTGTMWWVRAEFQEILP